MGVIRERKLSAEQATEDKIANEMAQRLSLAEDKRLEQLSHIQDKARTHNTMVDQKVEMH